MLELKTRAGTWPSVYETNKLKGQYPIKSEGSQNNGAAIHPLTMECGGLSQHLTRGRWKL